MDPNTLVPLKNQPQPNTQDPGIIGLTNLVAHDEHINSWIIDPGACPMILMILKQRQFLDDMLYQMLMVTYIQ